MDDIVAFLTSKTGIFASIVVIVSFVGGIQGLIKPAFSYLRERRQGRAQLSITDLHLSELSRSSNAYDLRFEIANTGGGAAVVTAVRLRVLEHTPSARIEASFTEAPVRVNRHRVNLQPDKDLYDIRARTYGPAEPPLSFDPSEVEAFVVKLIASKPQTYTIVVEFEWYKVKCPSKKFITLSSIVRIEFPARVSRGPHPDHLRLLETLKNARVSER